MAGTIIAIYKGGNTDNEFDFFLKKRGETSKLNLAGESSTLKCLADMLIEGKKDYPKGLKYGTRIEIKLGKGM